jgi:cbb3-type cytochrome oxidase subunit 3
MGKRREAVKGWISGGKPGPIEHTWAERPSGLQMGFSSRRAAVFSVLLLVVACVVASAWWPERSPNPYAEEPEPPLALTVAVWTFGGAVGLTALVGVGAVAFRLGVSAWRYREIARAEVEQARMVPKADNGLSPWYAGKGGLVDLDAAPARRVDKDGAMPNPETSDHAETADKARMMALAVGAGAQVAWEPDGPRYRELPEGHYEELMDGLGQG